MKTMVNVPGSLVAVMLFLGVFLLGSAALKFDGSFSIIETVLVIAGVGAILVTLVVIARRAMTQRHGDRS